LTVSKINTLFVLLFPFLWLCWKTTHIHCINTVLPYVCYAIVTLTVVSVLSYMKVFISVLRNRYL
jgi:hypothetical protein